MTDSLCGVCGGLEVSELESEEFEFEAVEVRAGVGAGVVADAVEDVDGGAWGESGAERGPAGGAAAPAESGDGGRGVVGLGAAGLGELQADVLVLDEADGRGESEVAGEEDGFGVADAEGAEAREPGDEAGVKSARESSAS